MDDDGPECFHRAGAGNRRWYEQLVRERIVHLNLPRVDARRAGRTVRARSALFALRSVDAWNWDGRIELSNNKKKNTQNETLQHKDSCSTRSCLWKIDFCLARAARESTVCNDVYLPMLQVLQGGAHYVGRFWPIQFYAWLVPLPSTPVDVIYAIYKGIIPTLFTIGFRADANRARVRRK